jgi:6-pyruvoyltetrahydropterin/6-carboxytetrahydropterin synthase
MLAIWIWDRLKPTLPQLSCETVHETCTSGCRYTG